MRILLPRQDKGTLSGPRVDGLAADRLASNLILGDYAMLVWCSESDAQEVLHDDLQNRVATCQTIYKPVARGT